MKQLGPSQSVLMMKYHQSSSAGYRISCRYILLPQRISSRYQRLIVDGACTGPYCSRGLTVGISGLKHPILFRVRHVGTMHTSKDQ